MKKILFKTLLFAPLLVSAQGLQQYIPSIPTFINDVLIPFLLGIAFVVTVYNVVRYFVAGSTNEEGRTKAKAYILYSIFAFVFILIFWGIINLLVNMTDLGGTPQISADYEVFYP